VPIAPPTDAGVRADLPAVDAPAADLPRTDLGGADVVAPQDVVSPPCRGAEGAGTDPTAELVDNGQRARVVVQDPGACLRTYALSTTAMLRDGRPGSPRTVVERASWPTVRTRNDLFDALYALAVEETRENAVDAIRDGAFDEGRPYTCPAGGCFETGRLWTYAWTRDGQITEHTGATVPASATAHGETWTVTATPNDGEADGGDDAGPVKP
jgi:hypothetical protein